MWKSEIPLRTDVKEVDGRRSDEGIFVVVESLCRWWWWWCQDETRCIHWKDECTLTVGAWSRFTNKYLNIILYVPYYFMNIYYYIIKHYNLNITFDTKFYLLSNIITIFRSSMSRLICLEDAVTLATHFDQSLSDMKLWISEMEADVTSVETNVNNNMQQNKLQEHVKVRQCTFKCPRKSYCIII